MCSSDLPVFPHNIIGTALECILQSQAIESHLDLDSPVTPKNTFANSNAIQHKLNFFSTIVISCMRIPCRNYTNICISIDSIRSSNVLKQDTESFYKSIAENKHNLQSQQVNKEENQTTTNIFSWGKLTAQSPSIFYCIFTKES